MRRNPQSEHVQPFDIVPDDIRTPILSLPHLASRSVSLGVFHHGDETDIDIFLQRLRADLNHNPLDLLDNFFLLLLCQELPARQHLQTHAPSVEEETSPPRIQKGTYFLLDEIPISINLSYQSTQGQFGLIALAQHIAVHKEERRAADALHGLRPLKRQHVDPLLLQQIDILRLRQCLFGDGEGVKPSRVVKFLPVLVDELGDLFLAVCFLVKD